MEEEIRSLLGARLREERERLGFSQVAFAALGDVSLRSEQDWERGVSAVKSEFLAVAAKAGVDVLYVITGVRGPSSPVEQSSLRCLTGDQAALLDRYAAADMRGRAALVTLLESLAQHKKST